MEYFVAVELLPLEFDAELLFEREVEFPSELRLFELSDEPLLELDAELLLELSLELLFELDAELASELLLELSLGFSCGALYPTRHPGSDTLGPSHPST